MHHMFLSSCFSNSKYSTKHQIHYLSLHNTIQVLNSSASYCMIATNISVTGKDNSNQDKSDMRIV